MSTDDAAPRPQDPVRSTSSGKNERLGWKNYLACAGCLTGCATFVFPVVLLFQSCRAPAPIAPALRIVDSANILSAAAETTLGALPFPPDVAVLIKTVPAIAPRDVASAAYDVLEDDPYWASVRPRALARHYLAMDAPWSTGVVVLISRQPRLIQLRFGERVRLEAYRAGLAYGPWYQRQQRLYAARPSDTTVVQVVTELSSRFDKALRLPFYLRWGKPLVVLSFSEFEELLSPGANLYNEAVFKAVARQIERLGMARSAWTYVLAVLLAMILGSVLLAGVGGFLSRRFAWVYASSFSLLGAILFALFMIASAFTALIALGGGRREDQLLLQHFGLAELSALSLDGGFFLRTSGVLLAAFIGLAALVANNLDMHTRHGDSHETTLNLGCIPIALFVLFVPRIVALFLLAGLVAGGVSTLARMRS